MYTVLHNDSDSCPHNQTSYKIGITPIVVGILSDVAACVGSLAIILLYIAWKDLRRGAQSIITWLAIADLCTAISYILGDVAVLHYDETQGHDCDSLCDIFCRITTYFVFCSITASFLWNAILAFHFYLILVCKSTRLDLATPLYHVIAWGLPVLIGLIFLSTETFPYAPFVSGVVCFSENPVTAYSTDMNIGAKVALKIPEFVGYFFMLILYIASVTIMCRKTQNRKFYSVQIRLACIPVLFILLRVWNTVQYFYVSLTVLSKSTYGGCIPTEVKTKHYAFAILQAFEGGQGWVNVILYIFLSKEMRKKLMITLTRRTLPLHQTLVPTMEVTSTKVTRPSCTYYSMPEDTS